MKKDKKRVKEGLSEALLEIVLSLVFFGIGALIIGAFGFEIDAPDIDFDLIVLIGIVALAVIFGIVFALVKLYKKAIKTKRDKDALS